MRSFASSWLKVVVIIAGGCPGCITALSQNYSLELWRHKDGLPSSTIYALAQSPDGFLWLGTADGLVRYDGFQFVTIGMDQIQLRPLGQVRALLVARDGALLAGGESGALLKLYDHVAESQIFGSPILALTALPAGGILVDTAAAHFGCLEDKQSGSHTPFTCVQNDSSGEWPREDIPSTESNLRKLGQPVGECREKLQALLIRSSPQAKVSKILPTRSGELWIATISSGVFVARGKNIIKHFTLATGLSDNRVLDLLEDRDASVWVATQNGLDRIRENHFTTWSGQDYFKGGAVKDLASGRDRRLWIAASTGLWTVNADRRPLQVSREDVRALQSDNRGDVTLLTDNRLEILSYSMLHKRIELGSAQPSLIATSTDELIWFYGLHSGLRSLGPSGEVSRLPSLPLRAGQKVTSLAAGISRQVWLGLSDGSLLLHDDSGDHWTSLKQGMQVEKISYLSPQPDGTLWVATDAGLRFFDTRRFLRWDRTSGLPGDRLLWAFPDGLGHLWIAYNFGLAEVSIDDLLRQAEGKIGKVAYALYDDGDGLSSNPEIHGQTPVALTRDGRLWMTVRDGVTMMDPSRIPLPLVPPPTHILTVTADGAALPLGQTLQLKPLTRTLTVTYTGISLSAPLKVRYRYRLDGFDDGWQDAAASRTATYTNLRPGSYRFHVAASNGGGWTGSEANFDFEVLRAFYQTLWFEVLSSIILMMMLVILYRYRLRSNERRLRVRYEDRIAERNRIALDLHDNLIQEMMGVSLQLEIADATTPAGAAAKKPIGLALELALKVVGEGRATLGSLRRKPFVLAELRAMLEDTAKVAETDRSIRLIFSNKGLEQPFTPEASDDVLHIAREALRNAIRHSTSDTVQIQTEFSVNHFSMIVRDRGRGIDPEHLQDMRPGHFGIHGMRERADRMGATLELHTDATLGTEWRLNVPGKLAYQDDRSYSRSRILIALRKRFLPLKNRS